MSDSSDDEPLAAKRAKLQEERPEKAKSKPQTQVKKEADTKAVPTKASKQSGKDIKAEPGTSAKSQGKSAKGSKKSDGSKTADVAVKREKKKFENPGQTRETPDELDPLRKFYTSLRQQRPESQMARKWMCMYGLLSLDEAEAFLSEVKKNVKSPVKRERPSQGGARAKAKPPKRTPAKAPSGSKRKAKPAIKEDDDEDSDDSEEEVMPKAKRPRVKDEPAETAASGKQPKANAVRQEQKADPLKKEPLGGSQPPKKQPKGKFAVFEDGMLDSDSDDDKPLGMRV